LRARTEKLARQSSAQTRRLPKLRQRKSSPEPNPDSPAGMKSWKKSDVEDLVRCSKNTSQQDAGKARDSYRRSRQP
jgi:hypothetical protein